MENGYWIVDIPLNANIVTQTIRSHLNGLQAELLRVISIS